MKPGYEQAASELIRRSGCTVRRYRTNLRGTAYTKAEDWGIEVPRPTTAKRFAVFAHEVGHQMLHRSNGDTPRYVEEAEAWEYALAAFDEFGLPGKEDAVALATSAMRYAIAKAVRRKADPDVIRGRIPGWYEDTR